MKRIRVETRDGAKGPYFVLLMSGGECIATSRIFRNKAWLRIGMRQLMEDAESAPILSESDSNAVMAGSHFVILSKAEHTYWFQLVTVAGRVLLTSREYENEAMMYRDIRWIQRMSMNRYGNTRALQLEVIAKQVEI